MLSGPLLRVSITPRICLTVCSMLFGQGGGEVHAMLAGDLAQGVELGLDWEWTRMAIVSVMILLTLTSFTA
jgi:hypothetical protein